MRRWRFDAKPGEITHGDPPGPDGATNIDAKLASSQPRRLALMLSHGTSIHLTGCADASIGSALCKHIAGAAAACRQSEDAAVVASLSALSTPATRASQGTGRSRRRQTRCEAV